jgi:hypothetical protein
LEIEAWSLGLPIRIHIRKSFIFIKMSSFDAADDDEDWLKLTPNSATEAAAAVDAAKKRQRKLINLDDLLSEKEHARKGKNNKNNSKKKKTAPVNATKNSYLYNSSSDDDERTEKAPKLLQELERSVKNAFEDEVVAEWGQSVFGEQRQPPPLVSYIRFSLHSLYLPSYPYLPSFHRQMSSYFYLCPREYQLLQVWFPKGCGCFLVYFLNPYV